MRLKLLMMMACLIVLAGGSCQPRPVLDAPAFCDMERPRRFTADEVSWRMSHAPANLRLDLATNENGKTLCGWPDAKGNR